MVQINQSDLDEINKTFKKLADVDKSRTFKAFSSFVYNRAIDRADEHTKTGVMMKSIFLNKINNDYYIGADKKVAPYALFVHWGTKPHAIKRDKRKALRWADGGVFRFAKEVHHPGYKGDPFLTLALDDGIKKLPDFFDKLEKELE